jgi:hypothetical protein
VFFGGVPAAVRSSGYSDGLMVVDLPQGQGGKRLFTLYVAGQVGGAAREHFRRQDYRIALCRTKSSDVPKHRLS